MGRVIKYWVALGTLTALLMYGGGFFVLDQINLTFLQFATVLCVPLFQAAVLVWRLEHAGGHVATITRSVFRHPFAQPVVLLDALLIGAGLVWWDAYFIGFGAALDVHVTWTLMKCLVAIGFFVRAVLATNEGRTIRARHVIAPVLLVLALEPSVSWLAAAFSRAYASLGWNAEVLQRLAFYVPLFSLLVVLTLRSARHLTAQSREAGGLLQAAVAAALVGAVTVLLASFNLPVVVQPWLGVATVSASMAASGVLVAAVFLATPPSRA